MAKGKKGTPEGVDELLALRDEIDESDYRRYWRRLNRARREGQQEFEREGKRILKELHRETGTGKFDSKAAAEKFKRQVGGRIIRRDASGRFSKRGQTFQVIGAKKR